jgi:hypothetical protein
MPETVNEWLASKGLDAYVWAFAIQGFEGNQCLAELKQLSAIDLDRVAVEIIQQAEEALGLDDESRASQTERKSDSYLASSTPGLRVAIGSTRTVKQKVGNAYTEYSVAVYTVDKRLAVQSWHRYKEFDELRKNMAKVPEAAAQNLPRLPPKVAGGSKRDAVVQDRMTHLRIYLNRLLITCPAAGRPLLEQFLSLGGIANPASRAKTATDGEKEPAVGQISNKILRLSEKSGLDQSSLDQTMALFEYNEEKVIQFLREQLGENAESTDSSDDENMTSPDPHTRADQLGRVRSGRESMYDPKQARTEELVINIIDETDSTAVLSSPVKLNEEYFSASGDVRFADDTPAAESAGLEPALNSAVDGIDLRRNLRAMGFEDYADRLQEHGLDDPSEWSRMDSETCSDMLDALDITGPEDRNKLLSWFHNPKCVATYDEGNSPREDNFGGRGVHEHVGSPMAPWSPKASQKGVSPEQRAAPNDGFERFRRIRRPRLVQDDSWNNIVELTQKYSIPEISTPQPLGEGKNGGLGAGLWPEAVLPCLAHDSDEHIWGGASGPQFSVVFTQHGMTHAWSKGGAGELRASCSNPWQLQSHEVATQCAGVKGGQGGHEHIMNVRQRLGYKLVNDAHSKTIGPNMNKCLSTLLESSSHEEDIYQIVREIVQEEEYEAAVGLKAGCKTAIVNPSVGAGFSAVPHCMMSGIAMADPETSDKSEAVIAMSSGDGIREAYLNSLAWRRPRVNTGTSNPYEEELVYGVNAPDIAYDKMAADNLLHYDKTIWSDPRAVAIRFAAAIENLKRAEKLEAELGEDRTLELENKIGALRQEWDAISHGHGTPMEDERPELGTAIRDCFRQREVAKQTQALKRCGFCLKLAHTVDNRSREMGLEQAQREGWHLAPIAGDVDETTPLPPFVIAQPTGLEGMGSYLASQHRTHLRAMGGDADGRAETVAGAIERSRQDIEVESLKSAFEHINDGSFDATKFDLDCAAPVADAREREGAIAEQRNYVYEECDFSTMVR